MPIYFKYNLEDLKELVESGCDTSSKTNEFKGKHHYYTCSCCHKEELYDDSPVLKEEVWNEVLDNLNIKDNDEISHAVVYRIPKEPEFQEAVRFFRLFKEINEVVPDDKYVMLCRDCMERALGRELYKEDLEDCLMTRIIINKFKNKQ